MKDTPMRPLNKVLLATAAFAAFVAVEAKAATVQFDCSTKENGTRICTGSLTSPTTVISKTLVNCDANLSLYRRSDATTNTLTTIAVGAGGNAPSVTVAPSTSSTTVTSRTDIVTGGQCVVYAAASYTAGATETNTFTFVEKGILKVNQQ